MPGPRLYRQATPIEEYPIANRRVFVKRDDLFGRPPAPPLGKLRGLRVYLADLHRLGVRLVGCWDTRVSRLGEGLAAAHLEFPGMRAVVSYPTRVGAGVPASMAAARKLGAQVFSLRGNHVGICYAQARRRVEAMGGRMIPFGLECPQAVASVAAEAAMIPDSLARGSVVLSCGSGVTLAGLLIGLRAKPRRVVGISSGRSLKMIRACIRRYVPGLPSFVELAPPSMPYDAVPAIGSPFPTHPNYDRKAWQFLIEHIEHLEDPVLFWNIGA